MTCHIKLWSKTLCIRFDKTEGFIRVYDGTRYLVLLGAEKYDAIYNNIIYFLSLKAVLNMFFLTITQKSELILMILQL